MTDHPTDLSTLLGELDALKHNREAAKIGHAFLSAYPALKEGIERLESWKAEALAVEAQWDVQAVGRAIGAPLGADIRPLILPAIERLRALVAQQREALQGLMPGGDYCCADLCDDHPHTVECEKARAVLAQEVPS